GVGPEGRHQEERRTPEHGPVRRRHDEGGQGTVNDRFVEFLYQALEEELLILTGAVQVDRQRVLLGGVVAGRYIDVKIALGAKGRGPDAAVVAVIVREID